LTTDVRIIAIDIDGTLLDSQGMLPPANVEALARAIEAGIEIVLATGRRYDFARPVFERLPRPLTLILSNGAVVKTPEGRTLARHLLPREVAREILAAVPDFRGRAALLFDRPRAGQIVYERIDWDDERHAPFLSSNRPFLSEVAPLEDALTEDPVQLTFTGSCGPMRRLFERLSAHGVVASPHGSRPADPDAAAQAPPGALVAEHAAADFPPRAYAVALTEYERRDFSLVDVLRAGCSKGAALREWAAGRGIPDAAIMAIGDNLNDLQMLESVGHPVVMANGLAELKARGWRVTASNDEAGVARAIDEILQARRGVELPSGRPAP
jgi:hydroxymethylpyrimidine pyrophosphatase-like HAD family hydrolase